jgi:hypothetical protein
VHSDCQDFTYLYERIDTNVLKLKCKIEKQTLYKYSNLRERKREMKANIERLYKTEKQTGDDHRERKREKVREEKRRRGREREKHESK